MKPLASRKQLLLAESELNRAQLVAEWRTLTGEVHALTKPAATFRSLAAAAAWVAGLAWCRRQKSAPAGKPPWWQTALKGAGLLASLWRELRAQGKA